MIAFNVYKGPWMLGMVAGKNGAEAATLAMEHWKHLGKNLRMERATMQKYNACDAKVKVGPK